MHYFLWFRLEAGESLTLGLGKVLTNGQDDPINDYTITMDIKLERLPKHGLSLYTGQALKKQVPWASPSLT